MQKRISARVGAERLSLRLRFGRDARTAFCDRTERVDIYCANRLLPSTAPVVRDGAAFSVRNFFFFWRWHSPAFYHIWRWRVPAILSSVLQRFESPRTRLSHLAGIGTLFPPPRTLRETHSGTRRCGTNPRVARERPNFSEASDIGSPSTAFEPNGEGLVHGWKRDRERSV